MLDGYEILRSWKSRKQKLFRVEFTQKPPNTLHVNETLDDVFYHVTKTVCAFDENTTYLLF